jgi:predicted O-methyltransferase YrrM
MPLPAGYLEQLGALPADWHAHGSLTPQVLDRIAAELAGREPEHSIETGTGKSTLLLSHLSRHHLVFTIDDPAEGSLAKVQSSPLFRAASVEFVVGPTQRTLRDAALPDGIGFALIDGPHAYPFPELEYFAIYPRLTPGALLIVDDVHIPTVGNLFSVIAEDDMFEVVDVLRTTAFLRRTSAPVFDPEGDSWDQQP